MGQNESLYIQAVHFQIVSATGKTPLRQIQVSESFLFWALDYKEPLQETAKGNRHVLVVMDHLLSGARHSPQKIKKLKLMPVIQFLYLSCFSIWPTHCWDEWLDKAVFAYNTSVHESTRISPYELVFGRPARMPIEVEPGVPLQNPSSQSDYAQSLRKQYSYPISLPREGWLIVGIDSLVNIAGATRTGNPLRLGKQFGYSVPKSGSSARSGLVPTGFVVKMGLTIS